MTMKDETVDNMFFVIRSKTSGLYLKKSTNRHYNDQYTNKLGRACIFSSKAVADLGYNKNQVRNVEVICMYAIEWAS